MSDNKIETIDNAAPVSYVELPPMKDIVREKLQEFVSKSGLRDWANKDDAGKELFYDFIRTAYDHGDLNIAADEFAQAVRSSNDEVAAEQIEEFYQKYHKGIEILLLRI
ncbi:MAG: hypothetical protein ACKKL5_00085 [Candidatus Komeilibacteria bacterium]